MIVIYCSHVERNNSEWISLNGKELNLENLERKICAGKYFNWNLLMRKFREECFIDNLFR